MFSLSENLSMMTCVEVEAYSGWAGAGAEPELMGGNIMITPTLASQLTSDLRPGICSSREF